MCSNMSLSIWTPVEDPLLQQTPETLNKRYRQKFSADDKDLFLRILNQHKHVIERKEGDVLTLKQKHAAWRNVLDTYNEQASTERDLHQLRLLWKRMKKRSLAPLQKKEQLVPEEFTVMVNPFDINALNANEADTIKSGIPTPSPDSSDCLDFGKHEDEDEDKKFRPLQIVLDAEGPLGARESEQRQALSDAKRKDMADKIRHLPPGVIRLSEHPSFRPVNRSPGHKVSAYEQRLLDMAEKEHAQKMALLKRRKQNEDLKEELLRLKIKSQMLKQQQAAPKPQEKLSL